MRRSRIALAVIAIAAAVVFAIAVHQRRTPPDAAAVSFETELERIRRERSIPGMTAAVAVGEEVVWARGFGWADVERRVPAEPRTVYHLASLTKPYAAAVALRLAEERRLDLKAAVGSFGVVGADATVCVEHLLSHTSSAPAGTKYAYDGEAYGQLETVLRRVTGRPFAAELAETIVEPLALSETAPNPLDRGASLASGADTEAVTRKLAKGYARKWGRSVWPTGLVGAQTPIGYPSYFGTSAGLVASAPDVARFVGAFNGGRVVTPASLHLSQSGYLSTTGRQLPYGLGWFVQHRGGTKIVWHYGHWFGSSSIVISVPAARLTFVVLANSDGLSRGRRLGERADVMASPVARLFFDSVLPAFTNGGRRGTGRSDVTLSTARRVANR